MIQSQPNNLVGQWQFASQGRHSFLRTHPVLVPLALFAGAILLGVASFFSDLLFPILALIGLPTALICCLGAGVLGLCGVVVSITGLLEVVDTFQRRHL